MPTIDEYDPYREANALPQANDASSSLFSPNRPGRTRAGAPELHGSNPTWTIVLTGATIILAVLLVTMGFLVQVFVVHSYHVAGRAVFTTASLGQTLAIAHLFSSAVGLSVPLTIGLGAYLLAGRWLAASCDEGMDRPTPYQLGVLMRTLNGANIAALWHGSNYIVGRGPAPGGRTLARPPILRHAVSMLLFFLLLAYAVTGTETWLGVASEAVPYPVTSTIDGVQLLQYGRQVNETECAEEAGLDNLWYQCAYDFGSSGHQMATSMQILSMNGISDTNNIALTDDSTAVIVPPASQIADSIGYVATTLGVKSTCTSVTSQCIDQERLGPDAMLFTNCSASVNFNTNSQGCNVFYTNPAGDLTGTLAGGPLGPDGSPVTCLGPANSTDFRFGVEILSRAYGPGPEGFVGDTGFFLHGNKGAYNVITCEMKSLSVTYRYFNGSYTTLGSSSSDLAQALRLSVGSWEALFYVPNTIDGVGLFSGSYSDAFAEQLSLVALSTTAYAVEPIPVLETQSTQLFTGSRIPLAPFLLLLLLAFIYCVLVFVLTVLAVIQNRNSPHAAFARSRLIDPTTAISVAYGPDESKLKITHTVEELFGDETGEDRLSVAVENKIHGLPVVRKATFPPVQSPSYLAEK
ncbi:hypothetical protein DFH09DRAFT_1270687 [Mycena vulgaris]|nr:hypothetical protein DFH09DRAFT_1270687 [Mycena vulgaris]